MAIATFRQLFIALGLSLLSISQALASGIETTTDPNTSTVLIHGMAYEGHLVDDNYQLGDPLDRTACEVRHYYDDRYRDWKIDFALTEVESGDVMVTTAMPLESSLVTVLDQIPNNSLLKVFDSLYVAYWASIALNNFVIEQEQKPGAHQLILQRHPWMDPNDLAVTLTWRLVFQMVPPRPLSLDLLTHSQNVVLHVHGGTLRTGVDAPSITICHPFIGV